MQAGRGAGSRASHACPTGVAAATRTGHKASSILQPAPRAATALGAWPSPALRLPSPAALAAAPLRPRPPALSEGVRGHPALGLFTNPEHLGVVF